MPRVKTYEDARTFLKTAGFCLRYWANDKLPIASMYEAVLGKQKDPAKADLRAAIELTNTLLEKHEAIELNVIANRVCLVHRSLMPALYKLVRAKSENGSIPKLSAEAREILDLLGEKGEIVTSDVRKTLGIASTKSSEDPAYLILSELQRHLLIDRGPFKISNAGVPYLAKEGYPYHLFQEAHLELVNKAVDMTVERARRAWLTAFSKSAPACPTRKIAALFKTFLTKDEVEGRRSTHDLEEHRQP